MHPSLLVYSVRGGEELDANRCEAMSDLRPSDHMFQLSLGNPRRVLCLGAHSDDIEIGCGGTILQLLEALPEIEVLWVVLCSNPARAAEARRSARDFLRGAKKKDIVIHAFRDGFLPYLGPAVKECFEELKLRFDPDLIFTHFRQDLHQDHRTVSELTWNTFRNHLILEYEIPKYDADLGHPNVFVPISGPICRRKGNKLMRHFGTQRNKHWFSEDLFEGLMRLRGIEAASPTRFAEAFHCRKLLVTARPWEWRALVQTGGFGGN